MFVIIFSIVLNLTPLYASEAELSPDAMGNIKSLHIKNGEDTEVRVTTDGEKNEHGSTKLTLVGEIKCPNEKIWVAINENSTFLSSLKKKGVNKDMQVCSLVNMDMDLDNIELEVIRLINGKCENRSTKIYIPIRKNGYSKLLGLCDHSFREKIKKNAQ